MSEKEAAMLKALEAVWSATQDYIIPNGISKDEFINRVIYATDNQEFVRALKLTNAKDPPAMTNPSSDRSGIADVIAERERQKSVEGWTTEHDDSHDEGEMAAAAACYASPTRAFKVDKIVGPTYEEFWSYVDLWPWSHAWWKPKDRRRDLVRAAALIVAEIERLDRLAIKQESK